MWIKDAQGRLHDARGCSIGASTPKAPETLCALELRPYGGKPIALCAPIEPRYVVALIERIEAALSGGATICEV